MFWSGNSVAGLLGSLTLLLQLLLPPETARRWESMEDLEIRVNSVNLKTYIDIHMSIYNSRKKIQVNVGSRILSIIYKIHPGKRSLIQVI